MSIQHRGPDLIREWLDETYEAEREAGRFLDDIIDAVPGAPQRRRRWWHRMQTGRVAPPPALDTTEYQPLPIQATNGHSSTVIGRTRSMLSPAKAATVGALVFAIGGVMLVAQPFDRRAVLPGADIEAEPAAPVAVTATSVAGDCPGLPTTETIGFVERAVGGWCEPTWTWSDERLNGVVRWAANEDVYSDGSGLTIGMLALSFENDEGAWRMRPLPTVSFPEAPATGADVWILDGEGAYEGLTAVLLVDEYVPHGFIIDGDLPPAPENASTK